MSALNASAIGTSSTSQDATASEAVLSVHFLLARVSSTSPLSEPSTTWSYGGFSPVRASAGSELAVP